MEQPKMPMLILDLQKTTTYNTVPLRLTQGDKGYIQPFTLTNAFQQYTVTADVLGFRAMKPDGKYIEIQNEPARFSLADGVWNFNLPDELTQAIGTVTGAYFYVKSGSAIVASTTKFNYSIGASWSSDEESNNYVTAFEELEQKLQDYVNAGAQTITVLNDYGEEARTNLSDSLASLTSEVTAWKAKTTSDIDANLASKKVALDKLQTDFTAKYNAIVAQYNTVTAEWTTKKSDYDKEFTASQTAKQTAFDTQTDTNQTSFDKQLADNQSAFDAEIAKIETEKTTALDKVASDATAKIADIQSQADAKLASIQKDWNALKTSLNAEIQMLSDKVVATDGKADEIKTRLDALTTQLDDIDIVSVKAVADKATADVAELRERKTYLHTAYSWSADGTDRFMTVYPGENFVENADNRILTMPAGVLDSWGSSWRAFSLDDGTNKLAGYTGPITVSFESNVNPSGKIAILSGVSPTGSSNQISDSNFSKKWGRYAFSGNFSKSDWQSLKLDYDAAEATKDKNIVFDKVKVEKGTATPYTPSPLDDPEGAYPKFIGTYTDYIADDSTDPSKYEWIPIPRPNEKNVLTVEGEMPDKFGNVSIPQIAQNALDIKNLSGRNDSQDVTISKLTKSVNGVKPDASGNISLPQPDLSPYVKTDAMNTALSSAKSYADTKKSEAQSYTDTKLSGVLKSWTGTQAQYDALATKDSNTLYIIVEGVV